MSEPALVATPDPWDALRQATAARVALGRAGASLPTRALLDFQLDHARARDAVHQTLDVDALESALLSALDPALTPALTPALDPAPTPAHRARGPAILRAHSAAADRATYLLRPDLGRRLDDASRALVDGARSTCDVAIVVADGLSATGVQAHVPALVAALRPALDGLAIGPLVVVEQARVAIGDEIGECLSARVVVVLIGERPGLTSADSVGAYLTFDPRVGRHDAERNCLSNIRPAGLVPAEAAQKLAWLLRASLRLSLSGVALKDESALIGTDTDGSAPPGDIDPVG